MSELRAPAFYTTAAGGWRRDVWAVLHPPYTAWHLSYVALGAAVAPRVDAVRLAATLLAFFFAVGVAAHALDELQGRPLRTGIPGAVLGAAAVAGLGVAVALGAAGVARTGPGLLPFIGAGLLLVIGYNLELFGGRFHDGFWFSLAWGAFPVLTAYFAQAGALSPAALLVAAAAFALSSAQRSLSTPARTLRRRVARVTGTAVMRDGSQVALDETRLLQPLERALRSLSWAVVALAAGLVVARFAG